jgi:hypothetical protein
MTEIIIDLNAADEVGLTCCGFADVRGEFPQVGDLVLAREVEDNVVAEAVVARIDADRRVIYVAVAWRRLREDGPGERAVSDPRW